MEEPPRQPESNEVVDLSHYFEVLDVVPGADGKTVWNAFRDLAMERHPDHGGSSDAFRELFEAYKVLIASETDTIREEIETKGKEFIRMVEDRVQEDERIKKYNKPNERAQKEKDIGQNLDINV